MASNRVLKTLGEIQLNLGDVIIRPSSCVKNLGVTFDAYLTMCNHIRSVVSVKLSIIILETYGVFAVS